MGPRTFANSTSRFTLQQQEMERHLLGMLVTASLNLRARRNRLRAFMSDVAFQRLSTRKPIQLESLNIVIIWRATAIFLQRK